MYFTTTHKRKTLVTRLNYYFADAIVATYLVHNRVVFNPFLVLKDSVQKDFNIVRFRGPRADSESLQMEIFYGRFSGIISACTRPDQTTNVTHV